MRRFRLADLFGYLTSGRIPFYGGGGKLLDDAKLAWDNTNKGINGVALLSEQSRTYGVGPIVSPLFVMPTTELDGSNFNILNWGTDEGSAVYAQRPFRMRWDGTLGTLLFDTGDGGSYGRTDFYSGLGLTGKCTLYNNVATEGYGLGAIVDDVALTAQAAAIGSTNFTNAGTSGTYRVQYYLVVTTADATAGSIRMNVAFNDGTAARTLTGVTVALTATNRATLWTNTESDGSLIRLGSGSISYSVSVVAGAINAARFSLYCTLERLN